jgi:hypothetical protein
MVLNSSEHYTDQIAGALDVCVIYPDGLCDSSRISLEFKHRPNSKEVHEQIETFVCLYVCMLHVLMEGGNV